MIKDYSYGNVCIKKSPVHRAIVLILNKIYIIIKSYGLDNVCIKNLLVHGAII